MPAAARPNNAPRTHGRVPPRWKWAGGWGGWIPPVPVLKHPLSTKGPLKGLGAYPCRFASPAEGIQQEGSHPPGTHHSWTTPRKGWWAGQASESQGCAG